MSRVRHRHRGCGADRVVWLPRPTAGSGRTPSRGAVRSRRVGGLPGFTAGPAGTVRADSSGCCGGVSRRAQDRALRCVPCRPCPRVRTTW